MSNRAFTLLEIMIAAAIFGIMVAVTTPIVANALAHKRAESATYKVQVAVNTGRDAAMESLRCVTVLNKLPFDGNGTAGIATYLHECNVSVDFEDPGANSTTISEVRMHPTVISSSQILKPGAGCVGTPPPEPCYIFAGNRFIYNYQDANASPVQDGLPYRIRVNKTDGTAERFVVHPATGTIRHEEN